MNPAPALADSLGAPASVTLTPGRRLIKVDWTAPVNPNGTVATYVATASTGESCTVNSPTLTCTITPVAANTSITVGVKACPANPADCSAATQGTGPVKAGPPGTPAAPTVVFKGNPNAVTLTWSAPDPGVGIDSYRITATPSSGLTGSCGSIVTSSSTTCDFAGLVDDTSYTFKVTAIGVTNSTGTTGTSAAGASSAAKVAGKPHAPAKPTATRFADDAVVVSWDRPTGGHIISGYTVTANPAAPQACTSAADVTECKVTGLTPATSYTFTVAAKGEAPNGGVSDASPASDPIIPGMPAKPATPTVELGAAAGEVTVYWDAPTEGGTVTTYLVEADSPTGGTAPTGGNATVAGTVTHRDFTGLQNGEQYRFRVTANSSAGNLVSDWSDPIVSEVPDKPATPTVTLGDAEGKVDLSWAPNTTGGPVVFYRVTAIPATGAQTGTPAVGCGFNLTTPTCTISGLDETVSYTFKVTAVGDLGSVDSDPSTSMLPAKPGAPTAPAVDLVGDDATVTWGAPSGGGEVATYTVTATVADGSTAPSPCTVATGNTLQCVFNSLNPAKLYAFTIEAVNTAGTSPTSAVPTAGSVPSEPETVAAALVTNTPGAVDVTWTAPAIGTATRYIVTADSSDGAAIPAVCEVTGLICNFTGLDHSGHYTFTARAENQLGGADAVATDPIVANVPAAPEAVAVAVTASGEATVTWDPSPDTGGQVATYTVTAASPDSGTLPNVNPCVVDVEANPAAPLSCHFDGMDAAKSYEFTARADNAAGGTDADPTDAVVPAGAGAPTNVQVALVSGPKVTVTWDPPTGGAPVTAYTVTASSPDSGTTRTCTVTPPDPLTCDFTNLTLTAHYSFVVRAANVVGGSNANAEPAIPFIPDEPGAPANVAAVRGNLAGKATVTWDTPTSGGGVVKYTVTPASTDVAANIPTACEVTTPNTQTCTFTTLTASKPYTFVVTATNTAGTSTPTSSTPALVPNTPDKPDNVVVTVPAPGQATVTWDPPVAGSAPPTSGWLVTPTSADGGATPTPATCTRTEGQSRICTFTGLTLTASYSFTVRATNEAGPVDSDPTPPVTANRPNQPLAVTVKVIDGATAAVTWIAPIGGGPITGYTVNAYTAGAPTTGIASAACTAITALTCDFDGLDETETYTFRVIAIGSGGDTQSDRSTAVTTAAPGQPAPPTVTLSGPRAVTLTWAKPTTGGPVDSYSVSSDPDLSAPARCTNTKALTCVFDRLIPGTEYTFQVSANGTGDRSTASDDSAAITIAADAPGSPGAPAVKVIDGGKVAVTWTAPTGGPITGYTVNAYTATAQNTAITSTACTTITTLTCEFDGLAETETYIFRVTATGPGGTTQGDRSTAVTTAAPGKPAPPTVTLTGPRAVTLTWAKPTGGPVDSYTVASTPDVSAPARCTNTKALTCVFDRLIPGTEYTFQVSANGTGDRSTASDASVSVAIPVDAPGSPGAPAVKVIDGGKVAVTWTAPTGGPITGYTVNAYTAGAPDTAITSTACTTITTLACEFDGLAETETYTFRVTASGPGGDTQSGRSTAVTTAAPGKPAPPTVALSGPRAVTITWAKPAGGPVDTYTVSSTPDASAPARCTNTKALTCVFDRLVPGTAYTFQVYANGTGDRSTASDASVSVAIPVDAPGTPGAPTVEILSGSSARVTWTTPVGGPVDTYTVRAYTATAPDVGLTSATGCTNVSALSCDFTGLSETATYTFRVTAQGSGGDSPGDRSKPVSTTGPGKPAAPTVQLAGPNAVTVTWTAAPGAGLVTGYSVTSTPDVSAPARCTNVRPPLMTCVFDRLRSGTEYTFKVVANGSADRATSSDASTPIVAGPPAAMAAPAASPLGATSVTVTWTTPTTGGPIVGYQVRSDPSSAGCTVTGKGTTSCVVPNLTGATAYTFQVKAVGAAGGGDSDWSPASAPITPGAPAAPTDLAVSGGDGQISVSWTAPAVTTGITHYRAVATPGNAYCETATNTDTECVITDVTNLAFYTVTVTAVGDGVSTTSAPSGRVRPTAGRPGSPTTVTATFNGNLTTVTWTAPASVGNGIGRYIVTAVDGSGKRTVCSTANGSTTSCNLTLVTGTYSLTVVSVGRSASGYSDPSTPYVLAVRTGPGVPTNVTVTNTTAARSLKVDWKAGATGDGVAGFTLTATPAVGTGTAPTCTTTGAIAPGGTATCTFANLTPGIYTVTVVARGTTGVPNSAASAGVQGTALAGLVPTAATAVPGGSPATLTVSSTTPKVGATITVAGSGFAAYTAINLAIIGGISLGTVTTDANGAFADKQVTIPAGTGTRTLAAVGLPPTGTVLRYQTAALTVTTTA